MDKPDPIPSRTGENRPRKVSRRAFLQRGAVVAGALTAGTGAYGHWVEPERVLLRRVRVSLPGWRADWAPLRVGLISDVHVDCDDALRRAGRAARLLADARPDVVALTGDFVTYKPRRWSEPCARALAPLAGISGGAYAVLGNHDWWAGDPGLVARALEAAGVAVLRNRSLPVEARPGLWVTGLDSVCQHAQRVQRALRGVPDQAVRLLLVHEPDYADQAPPGFALQLSGHSHGGQIRVPGLGAPHTPRWARHYILGLEQSQNHAVYTTAGVGVVGPRVRLFCPPEVVVLELGPAPPGTRPSEAA